MASIERRFARADIAIHFNLPWYICLWRLFKRLWYPRDNRIDDRAPNSLERVTWDLIKYMLFFRQRYNHKIDDLAKAYSRVRFIEVKSDADVQSFMRQICHK